LSWQNINPTSPSSHEAGKERGTFTIDEVTSFFVPEKPGAANQSHKRNHTQVFVLHFAINALVQGAKCFCILDPINLENNKGNLLSQII
jgi:hypothetical protein